MKLYFSITGAGNTAVELANLRLGVPKGKKWTIEEMKGQSAANVNTVCTILVGGDQRFQYTPRTSSTPVPVNEEFEEGTEIILTITNLEALAQIASFTIGVDEHA